MTNSHDTSGLTRSQATVGVVGLDWEKDGWRVSYAGAPAIRMSREELLTEPFKGVDVVVVEQPHMRERNVYSVAQVYTTEQLTQLVCRHKIKLFPAKLTYKASRFAGFVDAQDKVRKEKDAEAIAIYATVNPAQLASWKPYRLPCEDPARALWPARDKLRDDIREVLNPVRTAWNNKPVAEKYLLPEVARFCALLDANFQDIPEECRELFGIRQSRNGLRVDRMAVALTLYFAVYTREGELRLNPDGEFIGSQFIRDSIGLSHSHKPNMARSQLTWHGMRHYSGARSEYMRAIRRFITFLANL